MNRSVALVLLAAVSVSVVGCAAEADAGAMSEEDLKATKTLLCASSSDATVYFGQASQIRLEANVAKDGVLANAALSMTKDDKLGIRNETWTAQKKYAPQSARYRGMQKYASADAWCGYSVIAPPDLNGQTGKFSVYVQQACEGGFVSTATLSCKVESKSAAKPDAPSAPAAVELRFSAARKQAAIAGGYYEAAQFTGNTVVVSSAKTDLDLDRLLPEDDTDDAPDTLCYTGDATSAKKILWSMLGNTDGNGDHWLDEGATIEANAAKTLTVAYSVTGEGGSQPRSLAVPLCK